VCHQLHEIDDLGRVESVGRDHLRPEQVLGDDGRMAGLARYEHGRDGAGAGDVDEHVRVDAHPVQRRLVLGAEAGQRRQVRAPGGGEAVAAAGQRHAAVIPLRVVGCAAAEGGHDRDQLGVHRGTVQALVVVVNQDLPVGLHLGHRAVADPQRRQVEARQRQRGEVLICQRLLERHRIGVEVDEQEALPDRDLDRPQAQAVAVDLVLAHVGRSDQAAFEGVGPGVVGALDGALHAAGVVVAEP
jgi:hypothetical protein